MAKTKPAKPNVLWLTMDHVTFHHYRHMQGALPLLHTYEELCRQGTEFTNCKSAHPLCLPARATMLTGLYTHNHEKYRNEPGIGGRDVPLVIDYLREGGYSMGYFGKNHSGFEDLKERGIDCINFSTYGSGENEIYDEYGNPYMTPEYRAYLDRKGISGVTYHQEWGADVFRCLPNQDYDLTQVDNFNAWSCGMLDPDGTHEVDFLIDEAKRWLDRHKEKPFVLRVDTWGPHQAYQVPVGFADTCIDADDIELPPSFDRKFPDRASFAQDFLKMTNENILIENKKGWQHVMKRAYENYTYIDKRLGELIQWVKEIGLGDSTAILLTADHGDALATKGGMFDKCGDMPEELMEIPMVIYAPWMKGGTPNGTLVSNLDVVPTILDLLDLPVPEQMDGTSLKALAEGRIAPREQLMCEHYGHTIYYASQRALYCGDYKYVFTENNPDQLFDIKHDPFELDDLAGRPEYDEVLAEMKRRLAEEQQKFGDTQPLHQIDFRK